MAFSSCNVALMGLILYAGPVAAGQMVREDPIDKDTLLTAVRKGLPTDELIGYVQRRGVDFLLSPAVRKTYNSAGAHPRLIAAIEAAAREQVCSRCPESKPAPVADCPKVADKVCPKPEPCPPVPPLNIRDGEPVSKNDTLLLLEAGVSEERIKTIFAKRGVSYVVTPEVIRELKAVGASDSFVVQAATVEMRVPQQNVRIPQGPLDVIWGTQAARRIKDAKVVYPAEASQRGISGRVILTLLISKDGRVLSATYREGPQQLSQSAIDAARKWEFQPTLINGQAVEVKTDVPFDFKAR